MWLQWEHRSALAGAPGRLESLSWPFPDAWGPLPLTSQLAVSLVSGLWCIVPAHSCTSAAFQDRGGGCGGVGGVRGRS